MGTEREVPSLKPGVRDVLARLYPKGHRLFGAPTGNKAALYYPQIYGDGLVRRPTLDSMIGKGLLTVRPTADPAVVEFVLTAWGEEVAASYFA